MTRVGRNAPSKSPEVNLFLGENMSMGTGAPLVGRPHELRHIPPDGFRARAGTSRPCAPCRPNGPPAARWRGFDPPVPKGGFRGATRLMDTSPQLHGGPDGAGTVRGLDRHEDPVAFRRWAVV